MLTRLLLDLEQEEARRFERCLHRFIDAAHHPAVFNLPPALTRYGAGPWRRYRRTKADLDGHVDRVIAARRARSPAPAPAPALAPAPARLTPRARKGPKEPVAGGDSRSNDPMITRHGS
ncbi:hypothetical protein B7P34_05620 [Streptosporangium nondiastaticum]|uniref:Uncharacterized protein n=1 Tax=Streptosporangium nondiastaticum TaxID=35764 RepID=A0A9X7JTW4_9ACTN|nr:hypothetical protein [Streptosporangium nondiastaticum]PSJ29732.1 hypothetical protein B7P34_05620 [Streptosporangium nondiastaticum]